MTHISWPEYYQKLHGRSLRPLFVQALACLETTGLDPAVSQAIDLGCGNGTETLALLEKGWNVLAIDQQPEAIECILTQIRPEQRTRLHTQIASFQEVTLPPAHFLFSGYSLPFCAPEHFTSLWEKIVATLLPGGIFAGHFFGERDSWAGRPEMTFHTPVEIQRLFEGFQIEANHEVDEDGSSALGGPKHWHVFEVVAQK